MAFEQSVSRSKRDSLAEIAKRNQPVLQLGKKPPEAASPLLIKRHFKKYAEFAQLSKVNNAIDSWKHIAKL